MSRTFQRLLATITLGILLTILFFILYQNTGNGLYQSLYITFLTITYHFLMRVLVGQIVSVLCRQHTFQYDAFFWREHRFEKKLYRFLCVKKWKLHMITAKPEQFDIKQRSVEELAHNMTQAELVHEIIMPLSFVPVLWIPFYGAPVVFLITSILSCLLDTLFVIMQRYNRPRVLKILAWEAGKKI